MLINPTLSVEQAEAWRPSLRGMENADILQIYHALIPTLGPSPQLVELGVGWGRSVMFAAEYLAWMQLEGSCIWGIDTWRQELLADRVGFSLMSYHEALSSMLAHSSPLELERVRLVRATSVAAGALVADRSVDLVMIDGDHDGQSVARDIETWLPKVRPGGWIAGHDYSDRWDGVRAAVEEILGGPEGVWGTVWYLHN